MSTSQLFYHYTSTAGANGIRYDGILRSQNGVMLSSLKPEENTRDDILHSIHGNTIPTQFKNRADNIVIVDGSTLDSSKLNQIKPNLWVYSGDIKISPTNVKDKPVCTNRAGSSWGTSSQSSMNSSGLQLPTSSGSTTRSLRSSGSHYPKTLYYYMNKDVADVIKSEGGTAPNCNILLTTMAPESYFRNEILEAVHGKYYDRNLYATCADWCMKIDTSTLDLRKLKEIREEVYEYSAAILVDPTDVMDKPQCDNGLRTSDEYLYHYTDSKGAQAIQRAGYIKKSSTSGVFRAGVYLTDMGPTDFFRSDILKNNYGGRSKDFIQRADFVVRVKRSQLDQNKLKPVGANVTNDRDRKIFLYDEEIQVNKIDVYLKPKCYRAE